MKQKSVRSEKSFARSPLGKAKARRKGLSSSAKPASLALKNRFIRHSLESGRFAERVCK